jgi:hypothetical protein
LGYERLSRSLYCYSQTYRLILFHFLTREDDSGLTSYKVQSNRYEKLSDVALGRGYGSLTFSHSREGFRWYCLIATAFVANDLYIMDPKIIAPGQGTAITKSITQQAGGTSANVYIPYEKLPDTPFIYFWVAKLQPGAVVQIQAHPLVSIQICKCGIAELIHGVIDSRHTSPRDQWTAIRNQDFVVRKQNGLLKCCVRNAISRADRAAGFVTTSRSSQR